MSTTTPKGVAMSLYPYAARLRMLLAEAGYPDAHVYVENGIFIEGAPAEVAERAFDIVNGAQTRRLVQGEIQP